MEASQSVILQNLSIIAINIIVEHIPEKIKFLFHFLSNVFLYLKYCVILIKNKTNIPNKSPSTLYNFIPFSSSANLLLKILFTTGKEVKILTTKAKRKSKSEPINIQNSLLQVFSSVVSFGSHSLKYS